jgi:hypothetical protein
VARRPPSAGEAARRRLVAERRLDRGRVLARRDERADRRARARQERPQRAGLAGGEREARQLRVGDAPVRLVEPVDREIREELEPARGDPRDPDRDPAQVLHRVAERDLAGEDAAHLLGREMAVRDVQDAPEPVRRVEPDRLDPVGELRRHDEPAEQDRGRVVRGATRSSSRSGAGGAAARLGADRARQRVAEDHAADGGRGRRPEPARQRDPVVHLDPPAERRRARPELDLERRLEAGDEPVRAGRLQRALALAGHDELDRAVPVDRLDVTVFVRSSASPRQS